MEDFPDFQLPESSKGVNFDPQNTTRNRTGRNRWVTHEASFLAAVPAALAVAARPRRKAARVLRQMALANSISIGRQTDRKNDCIYKV